MMGKNKEQKTEVMNAFSRMNYLYQAAQLVSKVLPETVLPNYYGRLMKEVSKKVVEKIHPEVKRTLCSSCSHPLFAASNQVNVKIKVHKKKKIRKKRIAGINKKSFEQSNENCLKKSNTKINPLITKRKKDLKPNKLYWSCNKCGFARKFLLRPSHYLWTEKFDVSNTEH